MKSPKESRKQLDRINRLLRDLHTFKGWVDGEQGYMLFDTQSKEKFIIDEYDADLMIKALDFLQVKTRHEVEMNEEWCKAEFHVDIPKILVEADKKQNGRKKKKRGSRKKK